MKILCQIGVILGVCLVGEVLSGLLPFAFPASVMAMLLLFLLLWSRAVKPAQIEDSARFFQRNMAFFFLPSGVGILEYFDLIGSTLVPLLVICVVTTMLTFAASAFTVRGVLALQAKREVRHHG